MQKTRPMHIKLSESPKKKNLLSTPLRLNSISQDSHIQLISNLPAEVNNENDLSPNKYRRSRSISSHHSRMSDLGTPSQHERGRTLMNQFLKKLVDELNKVGREKDKQEIDRMIKTLDSISDFQNYVTEYFNCYNRCFKILISNRESVDAISPVLDLKLRKKILFGKDSTSLQKPSKKLSIQAVAKENEQLKKQVFKLRQSSSLLEKRILLLVAQYKQRKRTYMAEIQHLTNIINTTIVGIPNLLLQHKKKQVKQSSSKKLTASNDVLSMTHKQSDYNSISNLNDPLSIGLQNTYKVLNTTTRGLQRFKSIDSLREIV